MNRRSLMTLGSIVATLAALTIAGGCPNATDVPGGNSNANSGDGTGGGGGGGGGLISGDPVSVEQRSAALAAVDDILAQQSPADLSAAASAVAAALRSNGAIARAGVNEDSSVWAIFNDGAPLVVALNRPIPEEVAQAALAAEAGAPKVRDTIASPGAAGPQPAGPPISKTPNDRAQLTDSSGYSTPFSQAAYLFNSFGPTDEMEGHFDHLHSWLTEAAYHVTNGDRRGTIENFKNVINAGVLYVNGHGGRGYLGAVTPDKPDIPVFAFGTLNSRNQDGSTDATYDDDIKHGRVGFLKTPTTIYLPQTGESFGRTAYDHYFITEHFIRKYWSFSAGAQAYFDLCDVSGTSEVSKACFDKGAAVVIGWSGVVRTTDTYESSQFYFSRTLGALENYAGGKVTREEPPQRPFDTFAIAEGEMTTRTRTTPHALPGFSPTTLAESFQLDNLLQGTPITSHLIVAVADGTQSPMLRPSVSNLTVNEPEQTLGIGGIFGWNDYAYAVVTVGGQNVEVLSGGPGILRCRMTATTAGPVEVMIFGKKSNARNLTIWSGSASVEEQGPEGTLSMALQVKVRGDLLNFRPRPGEPPSSYAGGFGSTCIPEASRMSGHGIDQTFPCNRDDRSDNRYTVNAVGTYPPFQSLDVLDNGFFFGNGAPPPAVNESGVFEGNFYWVAYVADGVREEINCVENPRVDTARFAAPAGGVPVAVDVYNPNINKTDVYHISSNTGPLTYTSTLNLTSTYPPSTSDPR